MEIVVVGSLSVLLFYLAASTIYLLALALAYVMLPEVPPGPVAPRNSFAVLVPAHNEELLVGTICKSLGEVHYPPDHYTVFVIADNCTDATAEICRSNGVQVLERHDLEHIGKGQALAWAIKRIPLTEFDAVFIVDADNYVDGEILNELNKLLNAGERAIQCYNAVGNRDDSWFTRLLYVSRTICNLLYHEGKYRLGLSSYLMGNGLCFKSDLLAERGWTAFSAGEDWEYYAQLVGSGISIAFAAKAKVFHQESRSLNQATSQRLRWSSGRFRIVRSHGWSLMIKGIRKRDLRIFDASLPLLFPNYSLQINLGFVGLLLALCLPPSAAKLFIFGAFASVLAGLFLLFLTGVLIAGSVWQTLLAMAYVPFFLLWKAGIDLLCLTGLYRGRGWVRTSRHKPCK